MRTSVEILGTETNVRTSSAARSEPIAIALVRNFPSNLTEREWQVMALLRKGLAAKQIASELNCSLKTVDAHLQHIYRKLGVHNRIEALNAVVWS